MDDPERGMVESKDHIFFAARGPAGKENPVTLTKNGVRHRQRMPDGSERDILAVGLACSECFSGQNLYKILQPGFDYEAKVMKLLSEGQPAPPLSIHTSSGVPDALKDFLNALERHLPWKNRSELDWCVSLQIEGASAVWAAIDMVLQVRIFEDGNQNRTKVAVGATSYHGPPSTSFGANSPLWYKHHQVIYPVPTAYGSYDEEQLLAKYKTFLDEHGDDVGVILLEPQWGSSQAALPWPEHLLKKYVTMARDRNIKIVCDEIMCGLGRHGKGSLFVSEVWNLDPDAVTFGKAIATGVFPMSGAILKTGRDLLQRNKCTVLQSHTYAGSSTRALMAATAVLEEFVTWLPNVAHLGEEMGHIMRYLTKISGGLFICHGQGLMWGGVVTHEGQCSDQAFRSHVVKVFKDHCDSVGVVPYHVPVGGFMISPVIDIDVGTIYEIGERLEEAVKLTIADVGWVAIQSTDISNNKFLAPAIASASTLDLANLARNATADEKKSAVSWEQDLGNDKCVPHLHATRVCTACNSFVCRDVRTKFLI